MLNAWQAQQRVQKEEERKAKTEAVAAHQGYRRSGLSEEETKLAALREQERLQRQNAEEQLRGYRGQLSEEEAKLAAQKQEELRKKQELEEQLRQNGVVSSHDPSIHMSLTQLNSGVVSALAAGYSSPSPHKQQPLMPPLSSTMNEIPAQPDFSMATIPDTTAGLLDTVAASAEPATATAAITETETETETESEIETIPSPIVIASEPSPSPSPSPPPAPAPAPSTVIVHSSVAFMFGILTADDVDIDSSSPEDRSRLVEGYLARADQIARSVIADNINIDINNNLSFRSILSSLAYPVASSIEKDHCKYFTVLYCSIVYFAQSLFQSRKKKYAMDSYIHN